MLFNDAVTKAQSQTGSRPYVFSREKWIEYFGQIRLGDAWPVVFEVNASPIAKRPFAGNANAAPGDRFP